MTEEQLIGDRKATIEYVDENFEAVDKGEHKMVRIKFDDGEIVYLIPVKGN